MLTVYIYIYIATFYLGFATCLGLQTCVRMEMGVSPALSLFSVRVVQLLSLQLP